jgi:hypothetical protein
VLYSVGTAKGVRVEETIFVLRRWRHSQTEPWRWSLKDIKSGETKFFSSEEALLESLELYPRKELIEVDEESL